MEARMDKLKKLWRFLTSPEMILYIIFGVLTTAINLVAYGLLHPLFHINAYWNVLIANAIAWVLAVAFAFITNKLYVFRSKSFEPSLLRRELISFVGARLLTLGIDELGMMLLVSVMGMNDWIAKTIVNVLVIVLNYILSKLFIFKKES